MNSDELPHLLSLQLGFSCLCFSLGLLKSGSMDIFMVQKTSKVSSVLEAGTKHANLWTHISKFEWPQTLKITIPKKQAVHHVIFFLQYEMWQQDGLINMEAGRTKLRFPKRSVVFQRLIFSSHLQLERCWILNPKTQHIKRMEQFLKSSKWHPAELWYAFSQHFTPKIIWFVGTNMECFLFPGMRSPPPIPILGHLRRFLFGWFLRLRAKKVLHFFHHEMGGWLWHPNIQQSFWRVILKQQFQ